MKKINVRGFLNEDNEIDLRAQESYIAPAKGIIIEMGQILKTISVEYFELKNFPTQVAVNINKAGKMTVRVL